MRFEARELTKSFSGKQVLFGVNLAAQSGRAMGFLGRNGAGKTTTLRIMLGVFAADSGQVLLDGAPPDYEHLRFGYMPEERGLYPKVAIDEQLIYLGALKGRSRSDTLSVMRRLMGQLGIEDSLHKRLDTLSKGNQQKVQLVATLVSEPEILVLDEPFSGLDPVNAALLKALVREQIDQGRIVLFSSHQMHYVEEFCDDIAILQGGRVVLSGDLGEIKRGYERNRLWVRGPQPEGLEAFLRGLGPQVLGIERREGALLVTLQAASQVRGVMQALLSQELPVEGMDVYEPSLSDIFVSYTEEGV